MWTLSGYGASVCAELLGPEIGTGWGTVTMISVHYTWSRIFRTRCSSGSATTSAHLQVGRLLWSFVRAVTFLLSKKSENMFISCLCPRVYITGNHKQDPLFYVSIHSLSSKVMTVSICFFLSTNRSTVLFHSTVSCSRAKDLCSPSPQKERKRRKNAHNSRRADVVPEAR